MCKEKARMAQKKWKWLKKICTDEEIVPVWKKLHLEGSSIALQ
jgi:hypothetical protein